MLLIAFRSATSPMRLSSVPPFARTRRISVNHQSEQGPVAFGPSPVRIRLFLAPNNAHSELGSIRSTLCPNQAYSGPPSVRTKLASVQHPYELGSFRFTSRPNQARKDNGRPRQPHPPSSSITASCQPSFPGGKRGG